MTGQRYTLHRVGKRQCMPGWIVSRERAGAAREWDKNVPVHEFGVPACRGGRVDTRGGKGAVV